MKRRLVSVFCMAAFISMTLGSAIAGYVRADIPTIVRGATYDFYDATGGANSGHTLFTEGKSFVGIMKVEAYSTTIGVGYGAIGWGRVWKSVNIGQSGTYTATVDGWWWGICSAAGFADINIWFYVKVMNLDTGATVADYLVAYIGGALFWAVNRQGGFSTTVSFAADATYHYGIGIMVKAQTEGVVGSAIADALGDQGMYYTHIRISSPPIVTSVPPPSGGGGGGKFYYYGGDATA